MAFAPLYGNTDTTGTSTNGIWWDGWQTNPYYYSTFVKPIADRVETWLERVQAARERTRRRVDLPVWPDALASLQAVHTPPAAAARRTVVPRGVVSWIRAGTRRPL